MRIAMYANDVGPHGNNEMVAKEAGRQGHMVEIVGKHPLEGFNLLGPRPDFLITGLSSFKNADELALGEKAGQLGIPWVVLCDTHRAWARPPARGKVPNAILIIASPEEIEDALSFGYKYTNIKYFGGPPKWQEFQHIKPLETLYHKSDIFKIILVGGIKDAMLTDRMLELVVDAVNKILGKHWRLIFKPHPAEEDATRASERRARILEKVRVIDIPGSSTSLLASVDLSVFTGGATDTIAAAHLRRPAIFYEDEDVRTRNEKQLGEPTWYPAESGACIKAGPDSMSMKTAIERLLTADGRAVLRKRQEKIYPLDPQAERVESKIVKFLTELVGK